METWDLLIPLLVDLYCSYNRGLRNAPHTFPRRGQEGAGQVAQSSGAGALQGDRWGDDKGPVILILATGFEFCLLEATLKSSSLFSRINSLLVLSFPVEEGLFGC